MEDVSKSSNVGFADVEPALELTEAELELDAEDIALPELEVDARPELAALALLDSSGPEDAALSTREAREEDAGACPVTRLVI